MKKTILILSFILVLISCNKEESNTPVIISSTEAKINSYSKNYGYSGEIISIFGENFTDKLSDITLKFDEIPATIISASTTEIKFILPASDKVIPVLNLKIINRYVNNLVENAYNKNIGILPKIIFNSWIAVENPLNVDRFINRIQITNSKSVYYTMSDNATGNVVFRTVDDGITWKYWSFCGFASSPFIATINDNGWAYTTFGINKVSVGGGQMFNHFWNSDNLVSVFVNDNLNQGTIVNTQGVVSTTNDGVSFSQVFSSSINIAGYGLGSGFLFKSYEIDSNHIWTVGYKRVAFQQGDYILKPLLVYKNNTADGWKESVIIQTEDNATPRQVQFFLDNIGYVLLQRYDATGLVYCKIFKSINGGDTWTSLNNNEKFTNFTFKNSNIGWAIVDNKIYKTSNGGTSWQIDFTHDQNFRHIACKDNVVWAISKDKILKYYIQ